MKIKIMSSIKVIIFIAITISDLKEILSQDFSYNGNMGPQHWHEMYHSCDGKYQSPINIDIHNVKRNKYPPLQINGFDVTPELTYIENNGHTVKVTMDFAKLPTISGGPLNATYEFVQFHYHWGDNDTYGSEDMINDQSFPIELHIVFYKKDYNKFENALNFHDGIVVLAYFYEVSDVKNNFYEELPTLLDNIIYPGNKTKFMNGLMIRDLTTNDTENYFTYLGSLTTPPCNEVVTWIDFATPIPISSEQIDKFRYLHDYDGNQLTHNYRPIQPLNGRIIYQNVPGLNNDDDDENFNNDKDEDSNINTLENHNSMSTSKEFVNNDDIDKQVNVKYRKYGKNSSSKISPSQCSLLLILIFLDFNKNFF